jgi:hypothetical protein
VYILFISNLPNIAAFVSHGNLFGRCDALISLIRSFGCRCDACLPACLPAYVCVGWLAGYTHIRRWSCGGGDGGGRAEVAPLQSLHRHKHTDRLADRQTDAQAHRDSETATRARAHTQPLQSAHTRNGGGTRRRRASEERKHHTRGAQGGRPTD